MISNLKLQRDYSSNTSDDEVFPYTGNGGQRVPKDVVSVVFHPRVDKVDDWAFKRCSLKKLDLNEGLVKIGEEAFYECSSLESVTLPSTDSKLIRL